ncbi:UDP-N-acetyl-D-galactosamine dehydrogenase [Rhizobium leguminosarum]|jgi:UDP-N-acetyl-D-galactosamine dehydrogenase|uniref:nucleotide sugar dehydrogenase n=1 Tax=Rhizobium leguminosarum TaxID=384 RepID=UPI00064885ED|nr:nucleotide sugar dehydrogenase [Rhizobium leguminosarum]MDH6275169.1 UDP-N-acetyl-D-galactosamine dehydrogenase [Rhizobium leguminosarum]
MNTISETAERIAVIGLGYVGLPVAMAFSNSFCDVVGFDIDSRRVEHLRSGVDATEQFPSALLAGAKLRLTDNPKDLAERTCFVVTVPTPIDGNRQPNLNPLKSACEIIGPALQPGSVVIFESTVYPGLTEDICGPWLAQYSGLRQGVDFQLGYSPERINPGDTERTIEKITKIVAGQDEKTLKRVAALYGPIISAGLHLAPSIKVAEAAKVIENTQRDLNIALMNELSIICDRLGISTSAVLEAAKSKWNFLPFKPGLVGGHCIGVDPYYLTAKAESLGYHPEVILAGRRINDGMGAFVAQKMIKMLSRAGVALSSARVGILGLTFKEDVPDLRNSKVIDVITELGSFSILPWVHDPHADPAMALDEYGLKLASLDALHDLDGLIIAVSHRFYKELPFGTFGKMMRPGGTIIDVKGEFPLENKGNSYWAL